MHLFESEAQLVFFTSLNLDECTLNEGLNADESIDQVLWIDKRREHDTSQ